MSNSKIHEGRNIKRFREMLGVKQEALALELGDDWSQKKISLLESKETVEPALLQQISAALKIPVEAFQNFDEEQAVSTPFFVLGNNWHIKVVEYFPDILMGSYFSVIDVGAVHYSSSSNP